LLQRNRQRPEIGRGGDRLVRQRQQRGACLGQGEASGRAVEELKAGILLQSLELQADGRLGQIEQGSCPRNGAFAGYSNEAAQSLRTWELVHLED